METSIVILAFNSMKFIKSCLDSVFIQNQNNLEVIAVDNGSKDGTPGFIKKNYPEVILIENRGNFGAAKAKNQGIDASTGKWILTLDCDVILEKDFLEKMKRVIEKSEETRSIGMLQPKILNMDRRTIYSCGIYFTKLRRFYDIGDGRPDSARFNVSGLIFGACCAAGIYNREMLLDIKDDTGYFDERFFFMVEDVDLALRAQIKGWKALFCPEAACYHYGNSSFSNKQLRQFLCWRNRRLLLEKQRPDRFISFFISIFYDFPRLVFLFLTNSYVRNTVMDRGKVDSELLKGLGVSSDK